MSDDLEKRLDDLYRSLDAPARRLGARWKSMPARARIVWPAWIAAAAAVAAVAFLLLWPGRTRPGTPEATPVTRRTETPPVPAPVAPAPERPKAPPLPESPAPNPETPRPEPPPAPPALPRPEPVPAAPPAPGPAEPRRADPPPTRVERATALLRETEGSFDLAERAVRGRQKDLAVASGDVLRAATVVKLTLADDRFVLVAPRTAVEFRPDGKVLGLHFEQGEILAELVGPGPEIRVSTRHCEAQPLGTVFAVRADPRKTVVLVEQGRVEVRNARGKSAARAGEAVAAADDAAPAAVPPDFRSLAWARAHRPAERVPFSEDFSKPGGWDAEVEKGIARALPVAGLCAGRIHVESIRPPLFEVPVRGQMVLVCQADRAARMYVQVFSAEHRMNFRKDLQVLRGTAWRTFAIDFDDFVPVDKSKYAGKLPAGTPITDLSIIYGEDGEKGNLWVDAVRVTEQRP